MRAACFVFACAIGCGAADLDPDPKIDQTPLEGSVGLLLVEMGGDQELVFETALVASFESEPHNHQCSTTKIGACELEQCFLDFRAPKNPRRAHAAKIEVRSHGQSMTAAQDAEGRYPTVIGDAGFLAPDQKVRFTAEGDEIPGFDVELDSPSAPTITAPELSPRGRPHKLDKNRPLDIAWTGSERGILFLMLQRTFGHDRTRIMCRFDAVGGTGTIPQELLGTLEKTTPPFQLDAGVLTETRIARGRWNVNVFAYAGARDSAGKSASRGLELD